MRLIVLSPATPVPHEKEVLGAMLAAGLTRYHLRRPGVSAPELGAWIAALPAAWRPRIVVHGHPELAAPFGLGGHHESDTPPGGRTFLSVGRRSASPSALSEESDGSDGSVRSDGSLRDGARRAPSDGQEGPSPQSLSPLPAASPWRSRACHDLPGLHAALGRYDAVLVSPLFPSLSKPGYGPTGTLPTNELQAALVHWRAQRAQAARPTELIALGGITAAAIPSCQALGFDGVAVLGAVWQAPDPLEAFHTLTAACAAASAAPLSARALRPPDPTLAPCHA